MSADEASLLAEPIRQYCFLPSPPEAGRAPRPWSDEIDYAVDATFVVEENGSAVATASVVLMRQNLRGLVLPMVGISGVATMPQARRRGFARDLVMHILTRWTDASHAVSGLYPFRPSFYGRLGYVGLTNSQKATFSPADLGDFLHADLPAELRWGPAEERYTDYREISERFVSHRHGFADVLPAQICPATLGSGSWVGAAVVDGVVEGLVSYRIPARGETLLAHKFLAATPLARAVMLKLLATHVDQVAAVTVVLAPGELPELWSTDLAVDTRTVTAFPNAPAPMARILDLERLKGMRVGRAAVAVTVVDDLLLAGSYQLDGGSGWLEVQRVSGEADAVLTSAGLAGLIYGVLDPEEVNLRGLGRVAGSDLGRLRMLFPREIPFVHALF